MQIGILAVQGDYEAHARVLQNLGVSYCYVVRPQQLQSIQGLILPGGESTTMLKFLLEEDFLTKIAEFAMKQGYLFGTCAGAILLAKEIKNPQQRSLGLLDITIERNAYGRQLASQIGIGLYQDKEDLEMVFIRAPKITRVGIDVSIFATYQGQPTGVMAGNCMVTTFHPELTNDLTIHRLFIEQTAKSRV